MLEPPEPPELDHERFAQVGRRDPGRVEGLQQVLRLLQEPELDPQAPRQNPQRLVEEPPLVHVPDQGQGRLVELRPAERQVQLGQQVLLQGLGPDNRIVEVLAPLLVVHRMRQRRGPP